MNRVYVICVILALGLTSFNCAEMTYTQQGGAIGAGTGAIIGGIIGNQSGNTALGAILGAAIGGAAGAYIGNYMDKQAIEMEQDLANAKVERVGEGIKITFDSGILFAVNKADLQPQAQTNLTELAQILNKYPDTYVLIEGHTDDTGSDAYNLDLSQKRANSVFNYLTRSQVSALRLNTKAYGESQPIADNSNDYGRSQNRRVEIAIYANEELKKVAQKQAGSQIIATLNTRTVKDLTHEY